MSHWAKFDAALASLTELASIPQPVFSESSTIAARFLKDAQRFYLPDGSSNVLGGKTIDKTILDYIHLPFPITSILSETEIMIGNKPVGRGWRITTAIDFKVLMRSQGLVPRPEMDRAIALLSIIFASDREVNVAQRWIPIPFTCIWMPADLYGYMLKVIPCSTDGEDFLAKMRQEFKNLGGSIEDEFGADATIMMNLCTLLALHGTEKIKIPVPEKLNKTRIKSGKAPLSDYHVLKVGGEIWDRPESACASGGHTF